ncbi:MAG: hypothetical protein HY952_05980 [Elusimicrobia bacterium]|nr:hypothetical protein [Elusimicrobiota bacterium]
MAIEHPAAEARLATLDCPGRIPTGFDIALNSGVKDPYSYPDKTFWFTSLVGAEQCPANRVGADV